MEYRGVDPLALEAPNSDWHMHRRHKPEPQDQDTYNATVQHILKKITCLRNLRSLRSFGRSLGNRVPVPQRRDSAGCICSSRRGERRARTQAMNADALIINNVASRLQDQVARTQLYWFLCWWLVRRRPEEAKDDFQIVEDDDGMPWYSRQTVCFLPNGPMPSGFALSCAHDYVETT